MGLQEGVLAAAAFVTAAAARCNARVAGMQAANAAQALLGKAPLYGEDAFEAVYRDEGLDSNAVVALFREARSG